MKLLGIYFCIFYWKNALFCAFDTSFSHFLPLNDGQKQCENACFFSRITENLYKNFGGKRSRFQ